MTKDKKDKISEEELVEEAADIPEEEIDPKDKEIGELKDKLLRQMAEYDNYRKRTSRERMELEPEITARIVTEFLPVLDNLGHALANECTDPNYKKGVELICESFLDILKKLGVEEIETETFNPAWHQAVQQIQSDELESGAISATFQKGYRIGEKAIRFAMVAVVS